MQFVKNQLIAFIITVIIIIVLYNLASWNTRTNEDYLYGFWAASNDEFCEETEISSMMIFIGESDYGWRTQTRPAYIIIMDGLCNQGFTLKYKTGWASIGIGKYTIQAEVCFDEEDIWPEFVSIDIDMRSGEMRIYSGDVIYAKLVKQHDITNNCRLLEDAELIG